MDPCGRKFFHESSRNDRGTTVFPLKNTKTKFLRVKHRSISRQNIRETFGNESEFNYNMVGAMHAEMDGHYLDKRTDSFNRYKEYFNVRALLFTNYNL